MSDQELEPSVDVGYTDRFFFMPRKLRADLAPLFGNTHKWLDFLVEQTFGWHSRWVQLTYDEIINGRKKQNGERLCAGSGIGSDSAVRRAIKDALAHDLIEIRYGYAGTFYAVHRRYWASSKILPKWELFGRVAYNAIDDPLEEQATTIVVAEQSLGTPENQRSASITVASDYQDGSKRLPPQKQPATGMVAGESPQPRQDKARREVKDTSRDTSSDIHKRDTLAAAPPTVIDFKNEERKEDAGDGPITPSRETVHERQRQEELAREQAAVKQEANIIGARLLAARSGMTVCHAALDSSPPDASGRDAVAQKLAALQEMEAALLVAEAATYGSEERMQALKQFATAQARYNAAKEQERRPWLKEQKEEE